MMIKEDLNLRMKDMSSIHDSSGFFGLIKSPVKFRLFLLKDLPAAYFAGLRLADANEQRCRVSVPFKWFTKNPFRSTYFACLAMAAEMSTGVLAMAHIFKKKPAVSMLVVEMESRYYKKATGISTFVCDDGLLIKVAVETAVATGLPQTVKARSTGYNQQSEIIAEFWFTWSFKVKG